MELAQLTRDEPSYHRAALLKFDFEKGDRWWCRSEDEGVEGTLYQECWKGGHIRELHSLVHFTLDSLELDAILEHYVR